MTELAASHDGELARVSEVLSTIATDLRTTLGSVTYLVGTDEQKGAALAAFEEVSLTIDALAVRLVGQHVLSVPESPES